MQLPPFGIYLSTFDEFHWVASRDGREFMGPSAKLQEVNLAEGG